MKHTTNLDGSYLGFGEHNRLISAEGFIWFRHPPCGRIPALENCFSQVAYNGNSV
jgi:hypothetical protein